MGRDQLRWQKTGNSTWAADKRGFDAEIQLGSGAQPYQLTIQPGAVVTTHNTLGQAKWAFQKFLFNKPVQ